MKDIRVPLVPNARQIFDYELIPSLIFSDDAGDFISAVIYSDGEVLADVMDDTYRKVAEEQGITLSDNKLFTRDDFAVVSGNLDEGRVMIIVKLPEPDSEAKCCMFDSFILHSDGAIRFFITEKNQSAVADAVKLLKEDESLSFEEVAKRVPQAFLGELKADGSYVNCGAVEPSMKATLGGIVKALKG